MYSYYLSSKFTWKSSYFYLLLIIIVGLHVFWAAFFPMAHIEAYYWDWSRVLQLSYYDHPPTVAWVSWLGTHVFGNNAFGIRFFIVLCNLAAFLLLIKCAEDLQEFKGKYLSNFQAFCIVLIANFTPAFAIQSFLLMPDGILYLTVSGQIYSFLRIYFKKIHNKLPVWNVLIFGMCTGMGLNVKYHTIPIFLSLCFVAMFLLNLSWREKFYFILLSVLPAIVVALPTIYWNYSNDWISFRYQYVHGFGQFEPDFLNLMRYFLEGVLYYLPFLYLYSVWLVGKEIITKYHGRYLNNYTVIFTLPFVCIFIIFLLSSLFDYVHPYWNACAFWLLIPLLVTSFKLEDSKFFKVSTLVTVCLITLLPSLLCLQFVTNQITVLSEGRIGYQMFLWNDKLKATVEKLTGVDLSNALPLALAREQGCAGDAYLLASMDWTWTARMAFHFPEHPYVLDLRPDQTSYYSFRDKLKDYDGCKVVVLTESDFMPHAFAQIMDVHAKKNFFLPDFKHIPLAIITGTIKIRPL